MEIPLEERPKVNKYSAWWMPSWERLSACDNRPGRRRIYVQALDENGQPLAGVKIRFDTQPSKGIAYEHIEPWGVTDEHGRLYWDHLGIPTRYRLFIEDEEEPLITNIRTDLGNEYCRPRGIPSMMGWRPINRPGIYSYRFVLQRRGQG